MITLFSGLDWMTRSSLSCKQACSVVEVLRWAGVKFEPNIRLNLYDLKHQLDEFFDTMLIDDGGEKKMVAFCTDVLGFLDWVSVVYSINMQKHMMVPKC